MNHFFAHRIDASEGYLTEADSHHAQRVLRLKPQDRISVSFGEGGVYEAQLEKLDRKKTTFKIGALRRQQVKPLLQIAIAPTKSNDRFEWFLEKGVELGLAAVHPVITERSERKVYKTERGQRVMEAAFKQSHKGFLPALSTMCPLSEFLERPLPDQKLVASLNEGLKVELPKLDYQKECLILIGPEGDFSAREVALLEKAGFKHLDLGPEVLRTETAAVHICSIFNYQTLSSTKK